MQSATHAIREFEFSKENFRFLAEWVYAHTGIVLKEHKADMVYARISRRLRALGLRSVQDYCAVLGSAEGEEEMGNLINAITTNLTSFFREAHHFEHLGKQVAASFAKQPSDARLRIWSAGCSAGAEPYSIAMTLRENIPGIDNRDVRILATDIDTNMIAKGAAGKYAEDWIEKIPPDYQRKYVTDGNQMADSVRSLIAFKPLNLLEAWPMKGQFDAVFCRNVVIYFDKETQAVLFDRIAQVMKPKSFLYIGHSETLHGMTDKFRLVDKTTYQRMG